MKNKEALDALKILSNHTLAECCWSLEGEIEVLVETIRQALLNGVEEVTREQFNEKIKKYAHIDFPATTVMIEYPNGLKIIKDTKGD